MNWHDRATELTGPQTPDATHIRAVLEHAASGLLTILAESDPYAPLALLHVDGAISELDLVGILPTHPRSDGGTVDHDDIVTVLRWSEAALQNCNGDHDQAFGYALAVISVREAIAALTDRYTAHLRPPA